MTADNFYHLKANPLFLSQGSACKQRCVTILVFNFTCFQERKFPNAKKFSTTIFWFMCFYDPEFFKRAVFLQIDPQWDHLMSVTHLIQFTCHSRSNKLGSKTRSVFFYYFGHKGHAMLFPLCHMLVDKSQRTTGVCEQVVNQEVTFRPTFSPQQNCRLLFSMRVRKFCRLVSFFAETRKSVRSRRETSGKFRDSFWFCLWTSCEHTVRVSRVSCSVDSKWPFEPTRSVYPLASAFRFKGRTSQFDISLFANLFNLFVVGRSCGKNNTSLCGLYKCNKRKERRLFCLVTSQDSQTTSRGFLQKGPGLIWVHNNQVQRFEQSARLICTSHCCWQTSALTQQGNVWRAADLTRIILATSKNNTHITKSGTRKNSFISTLQRLSYTYWWETSFHDLC